MAGNNSLKDKADAVKKSMRLRSNSSDKAPQKGEKLPFGSRIKKWFSNIAKELKRVMWPDRKKLKQSTLTVLLIIALTVIIILVFDFAVRFIFTKTGLYSTKPTTPATKPAQVTETANPSGTNAAESESSETTGATTGETGTHMTASE